MNLQEEHVCTQIKETLISSRFLLLILYNYDKLLYS